MRFGGHDGEHGPPAARHRFAAMLALAVLALLLTACGPTLVVENIGRGEIRQAAASKAVVIGQFHIRSAAGKSIVPARHSWSYETPPEGATIVLIRVAEDGATGSTTPIVNAAGRFAWSLNAGTYVIERIVGRWAQMSFYYLLCPKIAFRVGQSAGIVNLGEIVIDIPPGQEEKAFLRTFCEEPNSKIGVMQREGEITKLVRQPLTPVVVAPELPPLWETSAWGYVVVGNVPEARAVLRRLGIATPGESAADGQQESRTCPDARLRQSADAAARGQGAKPDLPAEEPAAEGAGAAGVAGRVETQGPVGFRRWTEPPVTGQVIGQAGCHQLRLGE